PGATLPAGAAAELSVRPEQLDWQPEGAQDPAPPAVPGTCAGARFTGLATYLSVDLDLPGSPRVEVLAGDRPRPATGERLAIFPRPGLRLRSFPSDTSSSAGETNAGGAPLPR